MSAALEQTIKRLRTLVSDYAMVCGELSKALQPDDPLWHDLQDLGARCWALDDRRKADRRQDRRPVVDAVFDPSHPNAGIAAGSGRAETVEQLIANGRQAIGAAVAAQHETRPLRQLVNQLQAAERSNAELASRLQDAERMAEIRERTIADLRAQRDERASEIADMARQAQGLAAERLPITTAAVKTLESLAFTYHGGDRWLPPVGWPTPWRCDAVAHRNRAAAVDAAHSWIEYRTVSKRDSVVHVTTGEVHAVRLLNRNQLDAVALVVPSSVDTTAVLLRWSRFVPRETAGVEPDVPWPRK